MHTIEKNIPIPRQARRSKHSYLLDMEIGDSVQVDANELNAVRGSLSHLSRMHDMKFTTRTDDGTGKPRIWRVG